MVILPFSNLYRGFWISTARPQRSSWKNPRLNTRNQTRKWKSLKKRANPRTKNPACARQTQMQICLATFMIELKIKWKTAMTNLAAEDLVRRGGSRNHNDPISTPSDLLPRVSFVGLETELRNLTGRLRKTLGFTLPFKSSVFMRFVLPKNASIFIFLAYKTHQIYCIGFVWTMHFSTDGR